MAYTKREQTNDMGVRSASRRLRVSSLVTQVADIASTSRIYAPGSSDRSYHRNHALILLTRGGCRIGAGATASFDAQAGDLILMQPEILHVWSTENHPLGRRQGVHATFCLFQPKPGLEKLLDHPLVIPGYSLLQLNDKMVRSRVSRCLADMEQFFDSNVPDRVTFQYNLLEQLLLWCRLHRQQTSHAMDPRISAAIDLMSDRLQQPLRIAELAETAHLSSAQLTTLFRRYTGRSPMQYLEWLRLGRAMELLKNTGDKLESIAATVGFCDAKYFANRFKRATRTTPSAYRHRK